MTFPNNNIQGAFNKRYGDMASSDRSTRASTPGRFLRFALTGLALSACAAAALAGTGNGDLTDTNINYVGRWDKTNSTTYRSYWNGAYVSTKFTGTTVKVKLAEKTVFMAIVDGVPNTYWSCPSRAWCWTPAPRP
jgi:hypothetical protein